MFLGRDLVLPGLREVAFEEADDFLVEAAELTEESTGKGVSGRVRITESMRKKGSDSSELPQCRKRENYALRNGRRQKKTEQMGLRVAENAICGQQAHARTSDVGSRQLSPFWWGGSSQGAPSIPPQLCLYVSDFNRPCTHWVFKPMDPSKPNLVWPSGASDQSSTGRE